MYGSIDFIHILLYNICMENNYTHTNKNVSLINYHFVFYIRKRGEYYGKLYC